MTPTLDLECFRATSQMPDPKPSPRCPPHQQRGRFLKGPIPWDWLTQAARLPGKTLHVALELWRESGCRRGSRTVPLSSSKLKSLGVSRDTSYAALARLETAKLVSVERRRGRAPQVTILGGTPTDRESKPCS
jgi:hypothetical protein